MIEKIKLYAYAALVILVIWFGWGFYSKYSAMTKAVALAATNEVAATVSPGPTNAIEPANSTNALAAPTNNVADTNALAATNQPASETNQIAVTNSPAPATSSAAVVAPRQGGQGAMIGYLIAFVAAAIGLGLLIAFDVSQFMGAKTVELLFNDEGEGQRDPEYEKAEQVWANGKPLEAIQMMRDYLKDHPREQYVALRIGEIYEKDLRNYIAAALEYEEVLKHKFEAERWGWAAIHLCNIYSKMNQQTKTVALLERIVAEYPQTGAAKKARERLELPALPEAPPPPAAESSGVESYSTEEAEPPPPEPPAKPKSNLPPGFRPKK